MRFLEAVKARLDDYPPYYEAPEGSFLRLDQNANLQGPNPVTKRLRPDVKRLHLYPNRDNRPLMEAAARAFGVPAASVFVGNGSDEILDVALRFLVEPGARVAALHPSYSMYPNLCRANRLQLVPVAMDDGFRVRADAFLEAKADLALIANPNNPTGTVIPPRELEEILRRFPGPVVLDEAYAEFAEASLLRRLPEFDNLVIARTLSKAAALAGLRIGLGFAHPDVAELLRRAKMPFSINLLSEQYAVAALQRPGALRTAAKAVARERDRLARELARRGFQVVPSQANFLLTRPPMPSQALYEALRSSGILARAFPHEPSLRGHLRFTVGRRRDHDVLLRALDRILEDRP